ncbi:hypothetical protein [Pseudonocardia benzenivorans]|uniref:hypothetical protein n=1 Tax=Pseudonocardia benzenivorans TaxID=228005 RepID=UPI000307969A
MLVVLVALLGVGGYFAYRAVSGVVGGVSGLAAGGGGCPAVATSDVDGVLGGSFDVISMGGVASIAAPVLDSRVLADAPTCWAVDTDDSAGRLARIARYSGGDAVQRFAAEETTAKGTSEDRGNGITVSTSSYFNKPVQAGDQAFCTTGDMTGSAGALVRRGDVLVYVSTNAAGGGVAGVPQLSVDPSEGPNGAIRFATDDANCDLAVRLAATVK